MSDRQATLQGAILAAVESGTRDLYTCIPARVVKWDASKQRADCEILIKNVHEDEQGERVAESWPIVPGVPVQFMGAGGYRLTFPIGDGSNGEKTTGLLFFSHLSLDKWLTGTGGEVDPEYDHYHALGDAVFIPGLKPFGAPWQDVPTDVASFGMDSGPQVRISDSLITAATTVSAAKFVAIAQYVNDRLSTIRTTFNSHIHSVASAPGFASVPTTTIPTLDDVSASVLKAE